MENRTSEGKIQKEIEPTKKSIKINKEYIFKTSRIHVNKKENFDKFKIIQFDDCKTLKEVKYRIQHLKFDKFGRLFLFVIHINDSNNIENDKSDYIDDKIRREEDKKEFNHILNEISLLCGKEHPILVEYFNKVICGYPEYFYGIRSLDIFWKIQFDLEEEELKSLIICEGLLNDFYCNILHQLKCSILDADLNNIMQFIYGKSDKIFELCQVTIDSDDKTACYLINLFGLNLGSNEESVYEVSHEVFKYIIDIRNFDAFKAFKGMKFNNQIVKMFKSKPKNMENFLLRAIKNQNVEVAKIILSHSSILDDTFFNFCFWEKVMHESFYAENMEIFNIIKEANFNFNETQNKHKELVIAQYDKILKEIDDLHEYIKNRNEDKIIEFINRQNPPLKLCYGNKKICALEKAIDEEQIEIYSLLFANGFYTDQPEQLMKSVQILSQDDKSRVLHINLNHVNKDEKNHISILLSRCCLSSFPRKLSFIKIREMLEELNKIEEVKLLMKAASQSMVKIVFDRDCKHVKRVDPHSKDFTMGITYHKKNFIILGNNIDEISQFATFAHELCHYVLYFIYDNDCFPYCRGDTKKEQRWNSIVDEYEEKFKKDSEVVIRWVFENYRGITKSKELIVRVPHLLVQYCRNDKLKFPKNLKSKYKILFKFFDDCICKDILIEDGFELRNLNREFKLLDEIKNYEYKIDVERCQDKFSINEKKKIVIRTSNRLLTLSTIFHEIFKSEENKLNASTANIYVKYDRLQEFTKNELNAEILNSNTIKRIVIDATNSSKISYENFRDNITIILVVSSKFDTEKLEKFIKIDQDYTWSNFSLETNNKLLSKLLIFQGKKMNLNTILKKKKNEKEEEYQKRLAEILTHDAIDYLLACEDLKSLNKTYFKEIEPYINRNFMEKAKNEKISTSNFLKKIENENIVIIADLPATGKTITAKYIMQEKFIKNNKSEWYSFINIREIKNKINSFSKDESVEETIENILDFENPLEKSIFKYLYGEKKVTLFFDGYDEVNDECRENLLKIAKNLEGSVKQIFITSRSNLIDEIKRDLKISVYELANITRQEQIDFLLGFWEKPEDPYFKELAEHLITQLSDLLSNKSELTISLPLQIKIIAEIYENCDLSSKEIKSITLDFGHLYSKFLNVRIDKLLKIDDKINEKFVKKNHLNSQNLMQILYYYAFKLFFETEPVQVGLKHHLDEWPIHEVERYGIVLFGKFQFYFLHNSFAEYIIAHYIENEMRYSNTNKKELTEVSQNCLIEILTNEQKFSNTRMFLNDLIPKLNNDVQTKLLNENHKDVEKILQNCAKQQNFKLCTFLLKILKHFDDETMKKILLNVDDNGKSFLLNATERATNEQSFLQLIEEMLENEKFIEVLCIKDDNENTFFHNLILPKKNSNLEENYINVSLFRKIWYKIDSKLENDQRKIILCNQNKDGKTILHCAIENYINDHQRIKLIIEVIKKLDFQEIKHILYLEDVNGRNIFHYSARYDFTIFDFISKIIPNFLDENELSQVLKKTDNEMSNILHIATKFGSCEIFKNIFEKVLNSFENHDTKTYLMLENKYKENVVQLASLNVKNKNMFQETWNLVTSYCNDKDEQKKLLQKDDNKIILNLARYGELENFKFAWEKIEEIFDENEKCLLLKTESRKILLGSACNREESFVHIWELIEKYLKTDELRRILKEDKNFFHSFVNSGKKENMEIVWGKIRAHFGDCHQELKDFLLLPGFHNRNLLGIAVCISENYEIVVKLWNYFNEYAIDLKAAITHVDNDSSNVFHIAAKFSSLKTLEFVWEKIKEIYDENSLKEYLLKQNKEFRRNALQCAASNNNSDDVFPFLWNVYECTFNDNEIIKKLLLETDKNNNNLLFIMIPQGSYANINFFWNQIMKYYNKSERVSILQSKGFKNRNLLSRCATNTDNKLVKFIWDLCKKAFKNEELIEMIKEYDQDSSNAFDCYLQLSRKEIFLLIWREIENLFDGNFGNFLSLTDEKSREILIKAMKNKDKSIFPWLYDYIESLKTINMRSIVLNKSQVSFLDLLRKFGSNSNVKFIERKIKSMNSIDKE